MRGSFRRVVRAMAFGTMLAASGVAVVQPAATEAEDADPWEGWNRAVFTFNDVLDRYALKPVAEGYRKIMPDLGARAVTNFFSNLGEPRNLINSVLQGKGEAAMITTARFLFNSTFGLAGLIDVATGFDLPEQNEDFGQTLGYWGVESGPFVMLPLLGPSTVRDTAGFVVDIYTPSPWDEIDIPDRYYLALLSGINLRASLIPLESAMMDGDRYRMLRNAYLQRRDYQIRDGKVEDAFISDDEQWLEDF